MRPDDDAAWEEADSVGAACLAVGGDVFASLWFVQVRSDGGGVDGFEGTDTCVDSKDEACADGNKGGGTVMDGGGTRNLQPSFAL